MHFWQTESEKVVVLFFNLYLKGGFLLKICMLQYLAAGQMAEKLCELWFGQNKNPVGLEVQRFHHHRGVDKLALTCTQS